MINFAKAAWELFPAKALTDAQEHARREFPKESCGYIAGGEYVACINRAADPTKDFEIAPHVWQALVEEGREIEAVVHSHPNGPIYPSENDMRHQIGSDVPWVIITLNEDEFGEIVCWGDSLPIAPLIGRPFVWGVFDCFSLIRDYYRQEHDFLLPQVPREDNWWNNGQDLYSDYLKKTGFTVIDRSQARPGDGFLVKIESKVLNHAGILVENDQILHHLPNRLSRREPAGIWARAADLWVRHEVINHEA